VEFIKIQNSDETKKSYLKWIGDFMCWCNDEKIECVKINRRKIESYMVNLNDKYSPNSVRSKLMSICSFYTFLSYRYPKIIGVNLFRKLKLPKIKLSRRIDIITLEDIKILKKKNY
jgi:site-specific recombinase XerD